MPKTHVSMTVNGKSVEDLVEPRTLLIHFLREQLNLTGPHIGCETTHCGACTVDLDGKSVKSCTVFAVQAEGATILTIEGIAAPDGTLHALQEGFREMHGLQCGFCTPGMITRAYRLLQENPNPSEEEIRLGISGNLCRCTGYQNIVKAIQYAAAKIERRRVPGGRGMNAIAPTSRRTRRKAAGPRLQAQAGRRYPLRPGQGQLRRRPQAAGDALRRSSCGRRTPMRASGQIDISKAKEVPGVLAVLTAEDLKPLALHYMPTLAGDVQAVLAEEKVLFQNQEVAFVVADDRYAAADAVDLVEVDYEALPVRGRPVQGDGA